MAISKFSTALSYAFTYYSDSSAIFNPVRLRVFTDASSNDIIFVAGETFNTVLTSGIIIV
jgi:hypothetical protein